MVLQCAGIEFLLVFGDCDSEQITSAALAYEPAQTFKTRIPRPDMQIQAHRRSIVIYHSRVHLQRHDIVRPVLGADIGHFRTGPGYQIVHSARKSRRMFIHRAEMLDHGHFRELIRDQKQMRKHRGVFAIEPMENFDRLLDLDAARHIKKCS